MSILTDKLGITPGPWEVAKNDDLYINGYNAIEIGDVDLADFIGIKDVKLIAAAPDLLEALFDIVKIQNNPEGSLSSLNGTVRNAQNLLIEKFPKIKELI